MKKVREINIAVDYDLSKGGTILMAGGQVYQLPANHVIDANFIKQIMIEDEMYRGLSYLDDFKFTI